MAAWTAAAILLGTLFYVRVQSNPPCCDAVGYLGIAHEIRTGGLFWAWPFSELRTYLYPWFLSLVESAAVPMGLPVAGMAFVVQLLLHITAALALHRTLRRIWPRAANWSLPLVLCNPLLVVYVAETLTESLTISVTVGLLACVAALSAPGGARRDLTLWVAVGFLAGAALMIRPANLPLVPAALAAVAVYCIGVWVRRRTLRAAGMLAPVVLLLAFVVPLVPQLVINSTYYQTLTPFPATDLGRFQLDVGVRYLKYATNLSGGGAAAPYLNPWLEDTGSGAVPEQPLRYYWQQPLDGARVAALHIFNSVNHDYLFTYIYDRSPAYRWPLVLASQLLVFAGTTGLVSMVAVLWRRLRRLDEPWPLLAALPTLAVTTLALNAVVAVETRFGVLALVAMSVAVARVPRLWRSWGGRGRLTWLAAAAAWLALSAWLTLWVLAQSPVLSGGAAGPVS